MKIDSTSLDKNLSRIFLFLSAIALTGLLVVLFVLPTRTFHHAFDFNADFLDKIYGFLIFAMVLAGLLAYGLYRTFSYHGSPRPTGRRIKTVTARFWIYAQIVLSVGIFTKATSQITKALDWDESEVISGIGAGDVNYFASPFRSTSNHPLATWAAYGAIRIFGVGKVSARIPALLFTVLFLVVLNLFCLEFFSPPVTLLVLLHLFFNGLLVWYMHSMRGYIPMVLFIFSGFALLYAFTRGREATLRNCAVFLAIITAAAFTHTLGYIYSILLVAAFIAWLYLEGEGLNESRLVLFRRLAAISSLWLIVLAILPLTELPALHQAGFIIEPQTASGWTLLNTLSRVSMAFGSGQLWLLKLVGLLSIFAFSRNFTLRKKLDPGFMTLFVFLSATVLMITASLLRATVVEGRMIAPLVVILVLWIGCTFENLESKWARQAAFALAFVIFTVPQFASGPTLMVGEFDYFEGHEKFAARTEKLIRPFDQKCLIYRGDPAAVIYARQIYLRGIPERAWAEKCRTTFVVYFSRGRFDQIYPLNLNPYRLEPVLDDGEGRRLYKLLPAAE